MTTEFDDIRPYYDEELPAVFEELIADPGFRKAACAVMPGVPFEQIAALMRANCTKREFQINCCYGVLHDIARRHTDGVTLDHTAVPGHSHAYTYVTNHRDIILDPGFLSIMLIDQGMDTVEIAIGDNLLIYPWIKKLVRTNKSFIVQRALTMHHMLEASEHLSRYIHYTVARKNQSVWIAQREGRAKDSSDHTQESVLKMLAMGGEGSVAERLCELNIVPMAISCEYDPCDYLKAKELQQKRDCPDYKKSTADDLLNMRTGLLGDKGRVHFQAAACINGQLRALDPTLSKIELFRHVTVLIDRAIHSNYRLYPNNYVAHDLLTGTHDLSTHYTGAERRHFEEYIDSRLALIDLPKKDEAFLREKLCLMYANPLANYLRAMSL